MSQYTRRGLITTGLAGTASLAVAAKLADSYGLLPPDHGGFYGAGKSLTYGVQKILAPVSHAREFPRSEVSRTPFANETAPPDAAFRRLEANGFTDWRLTIDGMVARPGALSLAELKTYPSRSQITHIACEEGWSYVAEWTGVPLAQVLQVAGVLPQAKYLMYFSTQKGWSDSVDIEEALHPQTLVTYGMNGGLLPVAFGGPLRLRVPRQLGYKSVKYIHRITATDTLKGFSNAPDSGYSWYAGI